MFWRKGYEKTSLDDLIEAMGVGRQSLYNTFGDKRAIYLTALDEHRTSTQQAMLRLFNLAALGSRMLRRVAVRNRQGISGLMPDEAAQAGISFEALVERLLHYALARAADVQIG